MKTNYCDNSRYEVGKEIFFTQIKDAEFEIEYKADQYASSEQVVLTMFNTPTTQKTHRVSFSEPFKISIKSKVHGSVEFWIETPIWTINPVGSILTIKEIKQ